MGGQGPELLMHLNLQQPNVKNVIKKKLNLDEMWHRFLKKISERKHDDKKD